MLLRNHNNMKNNTHSLLIQYGIASGFLLLANMSHAVTSLVSTSRYSVTEGVAFALENDDASSFLFSWTDPSGAPPTSVPNTADPTLVLTVGQTYTFQRTTTSHPFVIMGSTAATFISGTDGAFFRAESTTEGDINDATLSPIVDFTANPSPTSDLISWTPSQVGDFWYTCSVTGHSDMAGKITVVPEPSAVALIAGGLAFASLRRRRN